MVSTTFTAKEFREWCRWLRTCAPVDKPVRIRRRRIHAKHCAECWVMESRRGRPKSYGIVLDDRLNRQGIQDALQHEWAHIRRRDAGGDIAAHDDAFWTEHGELYRAWNRTK